MNDTEENDEIQNIVNNAMDTVNETASENTVPTDATDAGELSNGTEMASVSWGINGVHEPCSRFCRR